MSKSKRKGDGYGRELAKYLDFMLFGGSGQITRTPLSGGGAHIDGAGKADLQGTPTVWVEAKRTERFQPYAAIEQAEKGIRNSGSDEMPVVIQRRNKMSTDASVVVMRLQDWGAMYHSWLRECGYPVSEPTNFLIEVFLDDEQPAPRPTLVKDDRGPNIVRLFPKNGDAHGEEENQD